MYGIYFSTNLYSFCAVIITLYLKNYINRSNSPNFNAKLYILIKIVNLAISQNAFSNSKNDRYSDNFIVKYTNFLNFLRICFKRFGYIMNNDELLCYKGDCIFVFHISKNIWQNLANLNSKLCFFYTIAKCII